MARKTGDDRFHLRQQPLGITLRDFWSWSSSDLLSNALRGMLAEFIVATDLGAADGERKEWDAWDLVTASGIRVEVKSAAYLQTWKQLRPSPIVFGIAPTQGWQAETNAYLSERKRQADVYVFCVLTSLDRDTVDPLDLGQWNFHVLPTSTLNRHCPN